MFWSILEFASWYKGSIAFSSLQLVHGLIQFFSSNVEVVATFLFKFWFNFESIFGFFPVMFGFRTINIIIMKFNDLNIIGMLSIEFSFLWNKWIEQLRKSIQRHRWAFINRKPSAVKSNNFGIAIAIENKHKCSCV